MSNDSNLKQALAGLSPEAMVQSDQQFNRPSHKTQHERSYTVILKAYATNIESTLAKKRQYKTYVFWLSFGLLVGVFALLVALLFVLIRYKPLESIEQWCLVVVPAVVSFLTVFIVIPRVITEYLFNADEEHYMSEIIKNIQNYDKESNA